MKYYSLILTNEYDQIINIDFDKKVKSECKSPEIKDIDNWTKQFKNYQELITKYEQKYNVGIKSIEVYGVNLGGTKGLLFSETIDQYGKITKSNVYRKLKTMYKKNYPARKQFIDEISKLKKPEYDLNNLEKCLNSYFRKINYKALRDNYFKYIEWKKELNRINSTEKLEVFYQMIKDAGEPIEPNNIQSNPKNTKIENNNDKNTKPNIREDLIKNGVIVFEDEEDFDPDKYIFHNIDNKEPPEEPIKKTRQKR